MGEIDGYDGYHAMFSSEEFEDMSAMNKDQILAACEEAKIAFTVNDEWPIELKDYGCTGTKTKSLKYDWFEQILEPIIRDRVVHVIYRTMTNAHKQPSSIDSVIIVGGSSNLKPFRKKVEDIFGRDKIIYPHEDDAQWSVAKGAALMGIGSGTFTLNDDVSILLSNDEPYPLLKKDESQVGTKIGPISFRLIEDSQSANFIFTDSKGKDGIVYAKQSIATKGFLQENLQVDAEIDDDQIAEISISNKFMGKNYNEKVLITKLNFYYNLPQKINFRGNEGDTDD